jgi:hypothetical protein
MKTELILIAIVAMFTSLSAFAEDTAQGVNQPGSWSASTPERSSATDELIGVGLQEGLCTVAQRKI